MNSLSQIDMLRQLVLNGGLVSIFVMLVVLLPLERVLDRPRVMRWGAGCVFGALALVSMQVPVPIAPGVAFDLRSAIAAVCTFWFGPMAGLITVAIAGIYRIWLSGDGAVAGVGMLVTCWLLAWMWRYVAHRQQITRFWIPLLGLALSVTVVGQMWRVVLPSQMVSGGLAVAALSFVVCTMLLGGVVELALSRAGAAGDLRKQAQTLIQREQEFSDALTALEGGQWIYDVAADEVTLMGDFYRGFGVDIGKPFPLGKWLAFLHPDSPRMTQAQVQSIKDGKQSIFELELRIKSLTDGQWHTIRARGRITERDAQGRALRVEGSHQDLTNQRRIEQALRTSQSKFAGIFDAIPEAAGIIRLSDMRLMEVNQAFVKVSGYAVDEVLGKTTQELQLQFDGSIRQSVQSTLQSQGEVLDQAVAVQRRGGAVLQGRISAKTIDMAGEPCAIFLFTDLTRQIEMAAQLANSNALLNEAGRIAGLGVWEADAALHLTSWTPICYAIHGLDPQEHSIPLSYINECVAEPFKEHIAQVRRLALAERKAWDTEIQIVRQDTGATVWVRLMGEPVVQDGVLTGFRGVIQDIDAVRRTLQALRESEERIRTMMQFVPSPISVTGSKVRGHIEVNEAWSRITGYSREEVLGKTGVELGLFPETLTQQFQDHLKDDGTIDSIAVELTDRFGKLHQGNLSTRSEVINGELCYMHAFQDLTQIHQSQALLREREEVLTLAIESAGLGYWSIDVGRMELVGNAIWAELHGMRDVKFPISIAQWMDLIQPEDKVRFRDTVLSMERKELEVLDITHRVTHPDGSVRFIRAIGKVVEWTEDGRRSRMAGINIDVTDEYERERRLRQMAHYDALTGLANRVALAERMAHAMAHVDRSGGLLGVAYMDLDGFKPVNDRLGHEAGDMLLKEISARLKLQLRATDAVARLGGDEFVILFEDFDVRAGCEQALQRVMDSVAKPYTIAGEQVVVTASVGMTLYPQDHSDADTLLRHADQAMYLAKQAGRNCYKLFDTEQDEASRVRHLQIMEMRSAIAADQFVLYYQPKVDMRTGEVIGAEALARWQHPSKGLLGPGYFLPTIEGSDLEQAFGEWVIQTALTQMDTWRQLGFELPVSVNVTARQLQMDGFAETIALKLTAWPKLQRGQLEVEVTESAALTDVGRVSEVLKLLREFGVNSSLDDFGTGYSSLTYLRRLPVTMLKIDQTFVRNMIVDMEDRAIVQGVIGLANSFGRGVIAEGVETEEQGWMLLQMGCFLAQGFGIARPMPADALPSWARKWTAPTAWLGSSLPLAQA